MYSGGIGYKTGYFAIDFAYVYSVMNEDYYMYTSDNNLNEPNPVDNKFTTNSFLLTFKLFMD